MNRFPLITLALLVTSLFASLSPLATEVLIYDRPAIAHGEIWRLLSGHLVHLSPSHLVADLVGFGITSALIEQRWGRKIAVLHTAMGLGIGLALWLCDPELERFGGLSGLAYGNAIVVALMLLERRGTGHRVALMVVSALLLKSFMDFAYGTAGLLGSAPEPFVTVPLSHLVGMAIACLFFVNTTEESRHVTV